MKTEQENKLESNDHTFRMNKQSYIGTMVGGCKIERVLGVGGNGIVFLAHDDSLDRQVAIKLFPFGFGADENKVTRFIREAKSIAKIDHPNIVQIHSVGQEEDSCYIVMQYIKGKTLTEFIKEHTRLSILDSLYITLQVANALETVHHINMIHRDIKPSNVIIEENGRVRVMDFGLVRNTSEDATMITQEGVYQGTPAYSSPEQCETTNIDTRSDLYSLGVIMYEMLAGKVPHQGETPLATLKKIVSEDPPPLEDLNPDVPENIIAIQKKLLQKDREDRYPSATELLKDLEIAIEEIKNDPNQKSKAILRHSTSFKTSNIPARTSSLPKLFKWVAIIVILTWLSFGVMHLIKSFQNNNTIPANIDNGKLTMAIYDFSNPTGNNNLNWLELGIPDMMMSSLAQYNNLNIINRSQVLWESKDKTRFDQSFREKLIPLGTKIVIQGSIYQENKDVRIVVHVYDFARNISLGSIKEQGSVQNIFSIIDSLTKKVNGFLAQKNFIVLKKSNMDQVVKSGLAQVDSVQTCEELIQEKFQMATLASIDPSLESAAPAKRRKIFSREFTDIENVRNDKSTKPSWNEMKKNQNSLKDSLDENNATVDGDALRDSEDLLDIAIAELEETKAQAEITDEKKSALLPVTKKGSKTFGARNKAKKGESFDYDLGAGKAAKEVEKKLEEANKMDLHKTLRGQQLNIPKTKRDSEGVPEFIGQSITATQRAIPVPSEKVPAVNLTKVLPYYYQGIQLLEKQNLTKKEFDKESKNLKTLLSFQCHSNPQLLEKSYKEWEEKLSADK